MKVCQHSPIRVCTAISCCQILADIFLGSIRKTQFAISTICQCCLHTKQHTHLCSAAAHLQSHSEREMSTRSQQYLQDARFGLCEGPIIYIGLNHISALTLSRQHGLTAAAVAVWRFHFLSSFLNCPRRKQQGPLEN